jgi:3-oxoacyl-[acyl-carrier protein] reductase
MDFGIAGKTALVLGASSGLGRATAIGLAKEGVNVALGARREDELAETAKAIEAAGGKALPIVWNLSDLASIDGHVSAVEAALGPIDILINNTGGPAPSSAAGQPLETWSSYFQSMVLSVIAITDRVLPGMRERKWGRIVTVTSAGVITPIPNLAMSNTLRSSLVGWSKTLSRELATDRIRFLDEAAAQRQGKPVEEVAKATIATIPMGRLGEPEEFAAVATFLASVQAAYVTGSVIRVDGGAVPNV